MSVWACPLSPAVALVCAPFLAGLINRTKAFFAGRKGQPLLQSYYDLFRLFRKDSVYSSTTTWVFRIAPAVIFLTTLAATCLVPLLGDSTLPSFPGDLVVLFYLLGVARFFLILSALDTGSAFEGMGASREAFYSALVEPITFVCLLSVMRANGAGSLVEALSTPMSAHSLSVALAALPLFLVLLAENARIPIDDPNTHLELTMIHEVMILDNSGRGLALMEYAAALKLWLFTLILGRMLVPVSGAHPVAEVAALLLLAGLLSIAVGVVESVMARVRLVKVPQLLLGAGVVAVLGLFVNITGALEW